MKGFTIIELMVVVAILAIVSTIAFQSYQGYILTANRTDGYIMANEILQAQERYFVENLTYTADLTDLGYETDIDVSSDEGYYLMTARACEGFTINQCVLVTGEGQGTQYGESDVSVNSHGTEG